MWRVDSLEKTFWCWEGLGVGGEGDDRGWDGWMESPTRRTWVWVDSGSWWWTGKPGVLQFTGSQRVGHNWATELNWTEATLHACSLFVPVWRYKIDLIFQNQGVAFTVLVNHRSVTMMKLGGSHDPDNDVYIGDCFWEYVLLWPPVLRKKEFALVFNGLLKKKKSFCKLVEVAFLKWMKSRLFKGYPVMKLYLFFYWSDI